MTASTSKYHHGDLRRALIDEATRTLEQDGVEAISFRGLARTLDVSHAAPGHHFADRQELLAELGADGYAGLADAMDEAMAQTTPANWLVAAGRAYIRFGLDHPELYRMMFASRLMVGECPPRLDMESGRAYTRLLKAVHGEERAWDATTYRVESKEMAAWSMVHGAVMLWIDGQCGPIQGETEFLGLADRVLADHFG